MNTTMKTCRCGCQTECKGRYAPGHDAKHKSRLLTEARAGSEAAIREMVGLGWGKHCDGDLIEAVPQRNSDGRITKILATHRIDMWQIDTSGLAHTSRRCKGVEGQIERWTIAHPMGWSICGTCTHEQTFLDDWQDDEVRRARVTCGGQPRREAGGVEILDTFHVEQLPTAGRSRAAQVAGRPGGRRQV